MENSPSVLRQPPPFPDTSRSVDLSPLEFVLALLAVITIPALIYAFFFSVKCPPWSFRRRRGHHDQSSTVGNNSVDDAVSVKTADSEVVSGVKYRKESHVKEIGSECPVCLSVFADGEDVKQLSACKHSFHASCIDMWFKSHSNCPICRAAVAVKLPNSDTSTAPYRDDDLHQGLPDASSLI